MSSNRFKSGIAAAKFKLLLEIECPSSARRDQDVAKWSVALQEYLNDKGIAVSAVLIRDLRLPDVLMRAIEQKKEREQEVEKQKAELERFRTEQQQKVAAAQAERAAAEEQAAQRRVAGTSSPAPPRISKTPER